MEHPVILATGKITDGRGELYHVFETEKLLHRAGCACARLYIDPLAEGWDTATGYPTRNTLQSLDMAYVADELEAQGKLGA